MTPIEKIGPSRLGILLAEYDNYSQIYQPSELFGYFHGDSCVGYCLVGASDSPGFATIKRKYVATDYRCQGIGTLLTRQAFQWAREEEFVGVKSTINGVFQLDTQGNVCIPNPDFTRDYYGNGGVDSLKAVLKVMPVTLGMESFNLGGKGLIDVSYQTYFEHQDIPPYTLTTNQVSEITSFVAEVGRLQNWQNTVW